MKGALDVHGQLLAADVAHEVVRLRQPLLSGDELPDVLGLDPADCAVVRCYVADRRVVAVLVRAGCVPDPVALLDLLSARAVRAATVEEVNSTTRFAARLVCPVGLPDDVVLLADAAVAEREVLHVPAGEGRVALGIRADALLQVTAARVVDLAARPGSPAEEPGYDAGARVLDLRPPAATRHPAR